MSALPKEISPESKCPRRRRISPIPDFPDDPHAPIVVASSISVGAPMAEVFLSYSQKDRTAVERRSSVDVGIRRAGVDVRTGPRGAAR